MPIKDRDVAVILHIYRDTYWPLTQMAGEFGCTIKQISDLAAYMGVKRDPKYRRPLMRGVLVRVPLPRHVDEKPVRRQNGTVGLCHNPAAGLKSRMQDRARSKKLWDDGLNLKQISARMRRARVTVRGWLMEQGVTNFDRLAHRPVVGLALYTKAERKGRLASTWRRT